MIFEIISGGEKTDWVGKEWAGLFFPRGKNGPAHSFPEEKTDWGEIPACYTAIYIDKNTHEKCFQKILNTLRCDMGTSFQQNNSVRAGMGLCDISHG